MSQEEDPFRGSAKLAYERWWTLRCLNRAGIWLASVVAVTLMLLILLRLPATTMVDAAVGMILCLGIGPATLYWIFSACIGEIFGPNHKRRALYQGYLTQKSLKN